MVELLELSEFNIIITVVDLVFKRVYFILTHTTITAKEVAKLFLYYV